MSQNRITPPVAEPVSVTDLMKFLGRTMPTDAGLAGMVSAQMSGPLLAARKWCEDYMHRVLVTQTWRATRDGFPCVDRRYSADLADRESFYVPTPPLQAMVSFKYVGYDGVLTELPLDTSYGTLSEMPRYAYQLQTGDDVMPAKVSPAYFTWWPPTRAVRDSVVLEYKCGYGAPATISMQNDSPILSGPKFSAIDIGQPVSIPSAAAAGATLCGVIAAVADDGTASLDKSAQADVQDAAAWVGQPIPENILLAIKFLAQFFVEQGALVDQQIPQVVTALLDPYRNELV